MTSSANNKALKCPHAWLEAQFKLRVAKNPNYSQRAFAQTLGIGSGRLSQLISSKRPLTLTIGEQICRKLKLPSEESSAFLNLISKQRAAGQEEWRSSKLKSLAKVSSTPFQDLTVEQTSILDPLNFAILSLMETKNFRSCPKWIAIRLKTEVKEIASALDRMERTGMVHRTVTGDLVRQSGPGFKTTSEIPSEEIRRAQLAILKKAGAALEDAPVEKRDLTSMIIAIDPSKLGEAKELIAEFRRKLAALLETGNRSEVYSIAIQLFPLTNV